MEAVTKNQKIAAGYLKWENDVIGIITPSHEVLFTEPSYNQVVLHYTKGAKSWTSGQLREFLSERIVSRDRRDIERILFRCGLSRYDVFALAAITKAMHPKDLIWIAEKPVL